MVSTIVTLLKVLKHIISVTSTFKQLNFEIQNEIELKTNSSHYYVSEQQKPKKTLNYLNNLTFSQNITPTFSNVNLFH